MTDKALREAAQAVLNQYPYEPFGGTAKMAELMWHLHYALAAPEPEGEAKTLQALAWYRQSEAYREEWEKALVDNRALAAENERLKRELLVANASLLEPCPKCADLFEARNALLTEGQEADQLRARIRLLEAELAEIYAALRADIPQSQIPSWAEAPAFKKGWAEAVQYVWYRVHRVNAAPPRGSEG